MGVCIERESLKPQPRRQTNYTQRQSFLESSFTYDPNYSDVGGFFYFDIPHYTQIQYLLRKSCKPNAQLQNSIHRHLTQIDQAIAKIKNPNFVPGCWTSFRSEIIDDSNQHASKNKKNEIEEGMVNNQDTSMYSNTLNFELVSISLSECEYEGINQATFDIYLREQKILSVTGAIQNKKWKPTSINKISIPNLLLNLETVSASIKIRSNESSSSNLECRIPCNQITLKRIIPMLQSSNIRSTLDRQPMGHVHFRIQYIAEFRIHKFKVVDELMARRKGLIDILDRIGNETIQFENSLILDNFQDSFKSDRSLIDT